MSAVFQSQNPILGQYVRNALLTALKTNPAAAIWPTPKIHLSQQVGFNPLPTDTNATLAVNEANFSGYASATPTFVVPVNRGTTTQALISTVVFEATTASPFVPNNLYGYWGDDGTNLFIAEAFGAAGPVSVASANDYVQIDVIFPLVKNQAA